MRGHDCDEHEALAPVDVGPELEEEAPAVPVSSAQERTPGGSGASGAIFAGFLARPFYRTVSPLNILQQGGPPTP